MSTSTRNDEPQDPITDALAERIAARLLPQLVELLERSDGASNADALIDQAECARRCGVSLPTHRKMNLPHVMCGDHRRYHWPTVLTELQRRSSSDASDGGDR